MSSSLSALKSLSPKPSATLPILTLILALLASGCGGGSSSGSSTPTPTPSTLNEWTWESGSNVAGAASAYGASGAASTSYAPSARQADVSWRDNSGNLWLFGGVSSTVPPQGAGWFNDLWEYSPTAKAWAWVSGSTSVPQGLIGPTGVYGTLGVASASNVPGGREGSDSWTDSSGNLWLFGGLAVDSTGAFGQINDLWEFNATTKTWTWVSGSKVIGAIGVYGTLGVASASNAPGSRAGAASWTDSSGNFWLFGGTNQAVVNGAPEFLNDLWEFSPVTKVWTWVSGSSNINANGVYGTLGTASTVNVPGGRSGASTWMDGSGNLWLFGGGANGDFSYQNFLNDLWEFSPTAKTWTWVSGGNAGGAAGTYGTLGAGSAGNSPGARVSSLSWTDSSGNLWLFGGYDYDSAGNADYLSDLWMFNPAAKTWTWESGSNLANAVAVYGTLGTAAASNTPGARSGSVSWTDGSGKLWLFGGLNASNDMTNDLWQYQP